MIGVSLVPKSQVCPLLNLSIRTLVFEVAIETSWNVTVAMVGYIGYTPSLLDASIYRSGPPQLPHSERVREVGETRSCSLIRIKPPGINLGLTPVRTTKCCPYSLY